MVTFVHPLATLHQRARLMGAEPGTLILAGRLALQALAFVCWGQRLRCSRFTLISAVKTLYPLRGSARFLTEALPTRDSATMGDAI